MRKSVPKLLAISAMAVVAATLGFLSARSELPSLEGDKITHFQVLVNSDGHHRKWQRIFAPWIHQNLEEIVWDYSTRSAAAANEAQGKEMARFYMSWESGREFESVLRDDYTLSMAHVHIVLNSKEYAFLMHLAESARAGAHFLPDDQAQRWVLAD